MNEIDAPYLPPESIRPYPLERLLPVLPEGMLSGKLREQVQPGAWLIDPLGVHPGLALEAARAGYRILVACNNPVLSFMLEVLASAPTKDEFIATLADLSFQRIGTERLDVHLAELYQTECPHCREMATVDAFLWHRDEKQPFAKLVHCPHCGADGEATLNEDDLSSMSLFSNDAMHRSRAQERASPPVGDGRAAVTEALATYTPRNLYFLSTLINRLLGPGWNPRRKQLLTALTLSACEAGSNIWAYPETRARPRQLSIPPIFRENNLWIALEQAIEIWTSQPEKVTLAHYPEMPQQAGICLYPGRMRSIPPLPPGLQPEMGVFVAPRPAQAVWTLSALWSGWLWGREAVQPLQSSLGRQNYDWYWLTGALGSALQPLREVAGDIPLITIAPELAPGFLLAVLAGPSASGYTIKEAAIQFDDEIAQLKWEISAPGLYKDTPASLASLLRYGVERDLRQRAEPADYLTLLAAGLLACASGNALPQSTLKVPPALFSTIQTELAEILKEESTFTHFPSYTGGEQSGWWHLHSASGDKTLTDRVEMSIVELLQKQSGLSRTEILRSLNSTFRGLLTPSSTWVDACLESYGEKDTEEKWHLRDTEAPPLRRADTEEILGLLTSLGKRIGFTVDGQNPVFWLRDGEPEWSFFLLSSSMVHKHLTTPQEKESKHKVLVLPGSRTRLLMLKLRNNPFLKGAMEEWHILKFRTVRQLATRPDLTPDIWADLLDSDPPSWEESKQLTMF